MVCTRQWRWLWKCSTIAYSNVRSKKKKKRKYNLAIQGGIYCLLAADDRCGRQAESLGPSSWRVTGQRELIEPKTPRDARAGGRHG